MITLLKNAFLPALAATDPFSGAADLVGEANPVPGSTPNLPQSIGLVINFALGLLGIIGVIMLLYAGILYMSSKGEAERVEKAKKLIKYSIWGLIIIAVSYGLSTFIVAAVITATAK